MNIFEQASRLKLRFDTDKGVLSVEDLWDVPLSHPKTVNLDSIAKSLFNQLREEETPSFVSPKASTNTLTVLKFELVRHVIGVKLAEQQAALTAKANKDKKQQILELIDRKESEQLAGQSLEDLKKLADSLEG